MSAENKARGRGGAGEQGSESDALRRWRPATDHWPLLAILATFLVLGLATSAINPLHEATDELRHYRFIQHIIQRHALPVQGQTSDLPCTIQGHHPPLYYATAALLTFWIDTGRDICYEPPTNPFWDYRYWEVGRDNKNQYLHGADESFPWHGEALAAHLARVVNLLYGAATVWLTWATARLIWPRRPALAAGSAAFVAFNPMFLYMAAAINNDVAAAMAGAAVTYACVRLLRDPRGLRPAWGVALGALYALALMSKFNLAAIIIVIEAAVTWVAWRRGQWRQWIVVNVLLVGVTALLAGWWFLRNQRLYGEPTGIEELTQLWGVRDPRQSFWLAVSELPYAWTSLWGRFGYGQIPLPGWMYGALFVVLLLAVGGYGVALLRRLPRGDRTPSPSGRGLGRGSDADAPSPNPSLREGEVLALLALTIAVFFAVLFNYLLVSPAGPMGRFFFPALPALGILMFYGLTLWGKGPGARGQGPGEEAHVKARRGQVAKAEKKLAFLPWRLGFFAPLRERSPLKSGTWSLEPFSLEPILAWAVNLGLIALSLVALFGYLRPAYARPAAWAEGATLPNPVAIQFDTLVRLRGYAIDTTAVRPGEPIGIDLYWEVTGQPPGDYLLFVHLVDSETGALVAQRDTHPGLGNFPSSQWRPGDRFVERLRLYVPETAYVPAAAEVRVGLYAPGSYRLGITDAATGAGLGDSFPLGAVAIVLAGPDTPLPNAGVYRFEDRFRLAGYAYDRRVLAAGEPLTVTLYWTAGPAPAERYDVQVRLLDEAGNIVHHEQRPLPVLPPGETVADVHVIPGDPARTPGNYTVQVSIEGADDRRLQLVGEDGRWLDDRLLLSAVRVTD
ncbi:MAG TPA: DUF2142 domain-containing protein, partial [Promineifilum sp.]|nr:DUF2142 domain-containing protein [Promineifilum sp.]